MTALNRECEGWLQPDQVVEDVKERLRVLKARIDGRDPDTGGWYPPVPSNVAMSLPAEWFFISIGVEDVQDRRETWYITRAPIGIDLLTEHVVHWTHWSHSVYVAVKDALEKGRYPERLVYGPPRLPDKIKERPVGPLVLYRFRAGVLEEHKFQYVPGKFEPVPGAAPPPAEVPVQPVARPRFGLRDIVDLMDWNQSEQIRGRMAGICLIQGGPGVGKTSVALHRIPYLLKQQHEHLPLERPKLTLPFFDESTMQVIVWKDHLIRYLRDLLGGLYCHHVPVRHVDQWANELLHRYVDIGPGPDKYRIVDEPERFPNTTPASRTNMPATASTCVADPCPGRRDAGLRVR